MCCCLMFVDSLLFNMVMKCGFGFFWCISKSFVGIRAFFIAFFIRRTRMSLGMLFMVLCVLIFMFLLLMVVVIMCDMFKMKLRVGYM